MTDLVTLASTNASVEAAIPDEQNPVLLYLASLNTVASRNSMRQALRAVAMLLGHRDDPARFPWHELRYAHMATLQQTMVRPKDPDAKPLAPKTIRQRMAAVRGVLRQAWLAGLLPEAEYRKAMQVRAPKGSRLAPGRRLAPGELAKLFATCRAPGIQNARDGAILALLRVGLRRSEVVGADLDGLDLANGWLRVVGKGNKERSVPLPAGAVAALKRWSRYRGESPGPLILPLTQHGRVALRRCSDVPYTLTTFARLAGVAPFTAHDLRRTLISDLLDQGMDIGQIRDLVGHESITTTAGYDRRGLDAAAQEMRRIRVDFDAWEEDGAAAETDEAPPDTERSP